jgi:hypothetical protein
LVCLSVCLSVLSPVVPQCVRWTTSESPWETRPSDGPNTAPAVHSSVHWQRKEEEGNPSHPTLACATCWTGPRRSGLGEIAWRCDISARENTLSASPSPRVSWPCPAPSALTLCCILLRFLLLPLPSLDRYSGGRHSWFLGRNVKSHDGMPCKDRCNVLAGWSGLVWSREGLGGGRGTVDE